jgi:hypothetical protein
VNAMDATTYFKKFAELLKQNPPAKEDAEMVKKLNQLGIIPGQDFDISKAAPSVAKGLEQSIKVSQEKIMAHEKDAGVLKNGWTFSLKTGLYGADYLQRAFIAAIGLGANRPQDAIYPTTLVDAQGKKLNGANRYVIHFAKDQLPPVNGFWSLTMYNDQYFFVDNPLNKYTVSERNKLVTNQDGSVDLLIQHESPGKDKEENWLPAPEGDFILMFRFYWPKDALLNGQWSPPAVELISPLPN